MRNHCVQHGIALFFQIGFCLFLISSVSAHSSFSGDSTFRNWYFTPTAVHGIIPLSKLANRSYVKISAKKQDEYTILSYNPSGIVLSTTYVKFSNGKIAQIITCNRWNEPFDSIWFSPVEVNEFFVTEKLRGRNPNAPCVGLRFVYKNDLLKDIYCMLDSNKTGYNQEGVAHYVFERYDDPKKFSLTKTESYFGDIDNPVVSRKTDCHKAVTVYDENGNLQMKSLYGVNDEPVTDRSGIFQVKMKYDKNNDENEIAYFDTKGLPWNEFLGCAIRGYEYKNGFLEKETFYRSDYTVTRSRRAADSVAIIREQHNPDGDLTEKSLFDERDMPVNNPLGIHRSVSQYNAEGMLTDLSFFDKKNFPTADESGVHRYHFEYDNKGQIISKTEFDVRDLPLLDPQEGAYKIKYGYDNWGRMTFSSYWINDSLKMSNRLGYHQISFRYDPAGMVSQIEYYDGEKKIASPALGFSMETLSYNPQEQIAERKYFKNDKPVMLRDSMHAVSFYSSIQYAYDFYNRVYSLEYFDDAGKAANSRVKLKTGEELLCHKVEFSYSGAQIVSQTFYDKDNTPLGNADCRTDNCVLPTGTGVQMKKTISVPLVTSKKIILRGVSPNDSLFFSDQISFLNKDSILIFLNAQGSNLSESGCATFYRIAGINKYFQLQGDAMDYYLDGDTLGAHLKYDNGKLQGPGVYYYKNGNIKEKGAYRDNQRIGTWDYYYENGVRHKTIQFTEKGKLLIDYFAENGTQLVQNGNGVFAGVARLGKGYNETSYAITGNIKNGMQDGEWKISLDRSAAPMYIEKFSSGKFTKGKAYGSSGEQTYWDNPISFFENIHPQDNIDHYGQNNFCSLLANGIRTNPNINFSMANDFYYEIHHGISNILQANNFKDYSGWVFLYMHFDEHGLLRNKAVIMYQENENFKTELLKFLDGLGAQTPLVVNDHHTGFSKFYVVLIENNQLVIPEELLLSKISVRTR